MPRDVVPVGRIVLLAVIALVLAVPLNLGVAWLATWFSPLDRMSEARAVDPVEELWWYGHLPGGLSADPLYIRAASGWGVEQRLFRGDRTGGRATQVTFDEVTGDLVSYQYRHTTEYDFALLLHVRAGWPRPAFHGWWWEPAELFSGPLVPSQVLNAGPGTGTIIRSAITIERATPAGRSHRLLPWRPAWGDLAINVLLYAGVIWLALAGPLLTRRAWRVARGRCIKCCYDLRGDSSRGCPECGWRREGD